MPRTEGKIRVTEYLSLRVGKKEYTGLLSRTGKTVIGLWHSAFFKQ